MTQLNNYVYSLCFLLCEFVDKKTGGHVAMPPAIIFFWVVKTSP